MNFLNLLYTGSYKHRLTMLSLHPNVIAKETNKLVKLESALVTNEKYRTDLKLTLWVGDMLSKQRSAGVYHKKKCFKNVSDSHSYVHTLN